MGDPGRGFLQARLMAGVRRLAAGLAVLCVSWLPLSSASAQDSRNDAETMSPSPRSLAMGGAGVALAWDDAFGAHYNPAHLADVRGLLWGHARSSPGSPDTTVPRLQTDYVVLGMGGLGFEFTGRPFSGIGRASQRWGDQPIPLAGQAPARNAATAAAADEVNGIREFGVGFRAVQELRGLYIFLTGGSLPPVQDYVDLYAGFRWKQIETTLTPLGGFTPPLTASARDEGYLLRLTPYHNLKGDWRHERVQDGGAFGSVGGLAVDLYAGLSHTNEAYVEEPASPGASGATVASLTSPIEGSYRRRGVGFHVRTGLPGFLEARGDSTRPAMSRYLGRLLALQGTYEEGPDIPTLATANLPVTTSAGMGAGTRRYGVELGVLDVFYLRLGREQQRTLAPRGAAGSALLTDSHGTSGFGIRLHYGNGLGVFYDRASAPEGGTGNPWSLTFKLDPYALVQTLTGS